MSDDLRTRIAEALCENSGLSWHTAWTTSRDGFLDDADAVLRVRDDEVERLEQERDDHRAAAERAEDKLRKIEYGCETPESHLYGCPCESAPFVADLKATIVSQAREIARLKGEGA
ncbi:hypothetical protein [Streptomyces sp. NPDC057557]|uniref:hypothetical protein n=1 Tax=Streptomyces sp. NPDC057557 TaxID=3346167 RepID=UPI00368BBC07